MISKVKTLNMIFNWILINKFAIGTPLNCKEDSLILKENRISSVLDLRNTFDFHLSSKQSFLEKKIIYQNVKLPDHNSKRVANIEEIKLSLKVLNKLMINGPVFMHCHAAVERSPLVSIAFIHKYKGLTINQAYDYVKQQNSNTNVSFEQLSVLSDLNSK